MYLHQRPRERRRRELIDLKERYLTSKEKLDQIICQSHGSKELLSLIKKEYETFINALQQGRLQADFLKEQCKSMASEPKTLQNLKLRTSELQCNIDKLTEENDSQERIIESHQRENKTPTRDIVDSTTGNTDSTMSEVPSTNNFSALGILQLALTLEECTNVDELTDLLKKMTKKKSLLKDDMAKNYEASRKKEDLVSAIKKKDVVLFHLTVQQERLQERLAKLKAVIEAHREIAGLSIKGPKVNMLKAVAQAINNYGKSSRDLDLQYNPFGPQEEDDPQKKKEAELILEYFEDFNDFLQKGDYKTAAWRAAKSPNGNLRTYNVMVTFQDLQPNWSCHNPWLEYCDALIATGYCYPRLSGAVSVEVMRCAIHVGKMQLATYWWNTGYLTATRPLGDLLYDSCVCEKTCNCSMKALAYLIYDKIESYQLSASCLVSCGLLTTAKWYCKKHLFEKRAYQLLIRRHPIADLIWILLNADDNDTEDPVLTLSSAIHILHLCNQEFLAVEILQKVVDFGIKLTQDKKLSLLDCFMKETVSEEVSLEKWYDIVAFCEKCFRKSLAENIIACIEVRNALHSATYRVLLDYIS